MYDRKIAVLLEACGFLTKAFELLELLSFARSALYSSKDNPFYYTLLFWRLHRSLHIQVYSYFCCSHVNVVLFEPDYFEQPVQRCVVFETYLKTPQLTQGLKKKVSLYQHR